MRALASTKLDGERSFVVSRMSFTSEDQAESSRSRNGCRSRRAVAGGCKRVALAQQLAAHRQLQQPEAEPSGPLEIVDVMLVLKLGGLGKWAKSSALLSYGDAFGMVL